MTHSPAVPRHCKVAIIGSGFSGLGMAIRLQQSGEEDFLLFEKDAGIGGTWRVNQYPGCACDVPSYLYSFSFEPNPDWSRSFAPQPEILTYLQRCWTKYSLAPKTLLNTAIRSLHWDAEQGLWWLEDGKGTRYSAQSVILGLGALSTAAIAPLPGLETFAGKVFHSQQWDHAYDLTGKRVAVIGTGASAIQFVPQIQPQVAQLDLYQRTAPWVMAKMDAVIAPNRQALMRRRPGLQKLLRGLIYSLMELRALGYTRLPKLLGMEQRLAQRFIRQQIHDPALQAKVTPDYRIGCKRILFSNDYYRALNQRNLQLVTDGIERVCPQGVVDEQGRLREADAIIFATGFTPNDPFPRGMITNDQGLDLLDSWPKGPEAYKGTVTHGFPNLYFLMGPNTGLGHSSVIYMIESQIQYVLGALQLVQQRQLKSLEVRREVQERFNQRLQQQMQRTVWNSGGCRSWYLHPVSGRNCTLWPGFTWQFRQQTRAFDPQSYHLRPKA
jgi:cation diffusion facilitator CzcD-associated flavoprotein CzcO